MEQKQKATCPLMMYVTPELKEILFIDAHTNRMSKTEYIRMLITENHKKYI